MSVPRPTARLAQALFSSTSNPVSASSANAAKRLVRIMEVSPRDGLQNEKAVLPAALKTELIEKLVDVGCRHIEAGSFVSPKWVRLGIFLHAFVADAHSRRCLKWRRRPRL